MASNETPRPAASQDDRGILRVPGVNMPVDDDGEDTFPSAVVDISAQDHWTSKGVTLREKRMTAFVSDITDKPEWERKVFDEDIVKKWRAEASESPEALRGDVILSEEMFNFVGSLCVYRA